MENDLVSGAILIDQLYTSLDRMSVQIGILSRENHDLKESLARIADDGLVVMAEHKDMQAKYNELLTKYETLRQLWTNQKDQLTRARATMNELAELGREITETARL